MKKASFKVSKYVKEKGYPQELPPTPVWYYYLDDEYNIFYGELNSDNKCEVPTYMNIWLWLWKEKKIRIQLEGEYCTAWSEEKEDFIYQFYYQDIKEPEEAIIAAIEYLVKSDLIK